MNKEWKCPWFISAMPVHFFSLFIYDETIYDTMPLVSGGNPIHYALHVNHVRWFFVHSKLWANSPEWKLVLDRITCSCKITQTKWPLYSSSLKMKSGDTTISPSENWISNFWFGLDDSHNRCSHIDVLVSASV